MRQLKTKRDTASTYLILLVTAGRVGLALPIVGGNQDYLEWIGREVG
jgi:hypothetical protein